MKKNENRKLGTILLRQKLVRAEDLALLLEKQDSDDQQLASRLLEKRLVKETDLLKALSEQFGIPATNMDETEIDLANLDFIPQDIAETHVILPIAVTNDAINLAMANPEDQRVIDEIGFVSGKRVFPHVAIKGQLDNAIAKCYAAKAAGETLYRGVGFVPQGTPTISSVSEEPLSAGTVIADQEEELEISIEVDIPEEEEVVKALSQPPSSFSAAPSARSRASSNKKTILVVDDEDDIRILFTKVLSDKGYEVITASRGLEAIQKIQSTIPNLIILDAMLPEVHGFDICKRMKSSRKYGHIPVLMISAIYRGWRYAQDLKDSYGVDAFIEKPFKISNLVDKVTELLAASGEKSPVPPDELSSAAEQTVAKCIDAYKSGNLDQAIDLLKQGLKIDPLAHQLHYHLALLLGKKNLNYQAIRSLENALELAPGFFPALKNLAVLYQKAGFKFKAVETWEKALSYCEKEEMREKIKAHLMKLL